MSRSQRMLEVVSQNIANVSTPGYKAHRSVVSFPGQLSNSPASDAVMDTVSDFRNGKIINTGNPLDFVIEGEGFFVVRKAGQTALTRNGQFSRDVDGRLVTAGGFALQGDTGDIIIKGNPAVTSDGVMLDDASPVARIDLVRVGKLMDLTDAGDGLFTLPEGMVTEPSRALLRQAMLETSNVSTADEMLRMMAGMRQAQTGQRLVQAYDDLIGKAITAFGQQ